MSEWTEGVCGDGAVFIKDGEPQTISQVLGHLNERRQPRTEDALSDGNIKGGVVAALVVRAGGEVRLRFRDLSGASLMVTHDVESDELVLRAVR